VEYLRSEKNLSEGGIDYYARKLKIFARWLHSQDVEGEVSTSMVKEFLSEREKRGVKALTRAKYVYSVRYFFDYLISRGLQRVNPAANLRITADAPPEQPVLSELETVQVIEDLERQVFENRHAEDVPRRMEHFRALRDLSLFLLFILTGVRLGEAVGMRVDDVDFVRRSVGIEAKGNRTHRKKHRELLLPEVLWHRLTQYLRVRSPVNP
jgi:site-specific recombinase XerD